MSKELAIDAERIGLPATASVGEIVEKVHSIPAIEAERDKWKLRAHELTAQNIELKKKVDDNDQASAELAVKKVFAAKSLDSKLEPVALEIYKASPALFQKWADAMEDKSFLDKTASLRGIESQPMNPEVEVESRAAELMAKDERFRGKKGSAMAEVLKNDADLSERYRAAQLEKSGAKKGGDR